MNRGYPPSGVPSNSVPPVGPAPVPPPAAVAGGPPSVPPGPPSTMGPMPPQPGMRPPERPMMPHAGPPPSRQYPSPAPVYQVFMTFTCNTHIYIHMHYYFAHLIISSYHRKLFITYKCLFFTVVIRYLMSF